MLCKQAYNSLRIKCWYTSPLQVTGWLLKNDMRSGLRKCFKYKTEAQMLELFDALDSDEPREMVNYYR